MENYGVYIANVKNDNISKIIKIEEFDIISYITFNNGGSWSRLQLNNQYLNIHANYDYFPLFYSSKSIPGLIIANGNIGDYLSKSSHEINTYISKDDGLNWKEVNFKFMILDSQRPPYI